MQQTMLDESVKKNGHQQEINYKLSKHAIGFSERVEMNTRTLR